jgi:hypothetical protein
MKPEIRETLKDVSDDVIYTLDLQFHKNLSGLVEAHFEREYPQQNEYLVNTFTLNPKVEIAGKSYSVWSEEFLTAVEKRPSRIYRVSLKVANNLCFNTLCTYLEVIETGKFDDTEKRLFGEFCFYLKIQIEQTNDTFKIQYKTYWREIFNRMLLSIPHNISFFARFDAEAKARVIADITYALSLVQRDN